jgi:hypothetical protein
LILSATVLVIIPRSPTKIISFNPYWRCNCAIFSGTVEVVIALLCSAEGCPVGVEVFAGNTQDRHDAGIHVLVERKYPARPFTHGKNRGRHDWRDSRCTMVLTGRNNRGMTWPEWGRERLISLVCRHLVDQLRL